MSSSEKVEQKWILAAMSAIFVTLFVWYARNQLLFTLYFSYQVARALLPGLVPDF